MLAWWWSWLPILTAVSRLSGRPENRGRIKLVAEQVKAVSNLKIDKVTVWDNGSGANGKGRTADFFSGLMGALPPLHELTRSVGIQLPDFLGKTIAVAPEAENDHAEVSSKPDTSSALRDWLRANARYLVAFDANHDNRLESADIARAFETAQLWAAATVSNADEPRWFFAKGRQAEGPLPWSAITAQAQATTLVRLGDSPYWLPFQAIMLARSG